MVRSISFWAVGFKGKAVRPRVSRAMSTTAVIDVRYEEIRDPRPALSSFFVVFVVAVSPPLIYQLVTNHNARLSHNAHIDHA